MKTIRLPDVDADRFLILFVRRDNTSHYVETRRCQSIQVSDEVVKLSVVPMTRTPSGLKQSGPMTPVPMPTPDLGIYQTVEVSVVR